jgi:cytoskeletal protein CcmA (bactofilin family)
MAIWKDSTAKDAETIGRDNPMAAAVSMREPTARAPEPAVSTGTAARRAPERAEVRADAKESLISAGLTIEGKIQGSGHVRIAGQFNGDVQVEGNLTIEPGAKLTGQVRANTVVVGGELEGNIDAASRVELLETGILSGDLKAASLIVAAGSRMRGRVEFGWEGKGPARGKENGGAS